MTTTEQIDNIPKINEEYHQHLQKIGYSQQQIQHIWKYKFLCDHILYSNYTGQSVLDYCYQKNYAPKSKFLKWKELAVYGLNQKNQQVVIIGTYNNGNYSLQGTVQQIRKNNKIQFFHNGQADKNTKQLALIQDNDHVPFPEFQKIINTAVNIIIDRNLPKNKDL